MTMKQYENMDIDNQTFYTLHMWGKDRVSFGKTYNKVYKRKKNADVTMQCLINSGKYRSVIMREEIVVRRRVNVEISSSGIVEKWEV